MEDPPVVNGGGDDSAAVSSPPPSSARRGEEDPVGVGSSKNSSVKVVSPAEQPLELADDCDEAAITITATEQTSTEATAIAALWTVQPWQHAFYHTTTSVLGVIAMVALPVSFSYLGWAGGIILLVASTAVSFYSGWIIIQLHEPHHQTYSDVADAAMQNPGFSRLYVRPLLCLLFFQVTVLICLMVGQSMQALAIIGGNPGALLSLSWWIVVAGATMFLLALFPTLAQSWQISLVGAISAVAGGIVLVAGCGLSIADGSRTDITFGRPPSVSSAANENLDYGMGILEAFGLIAFSFGGHSVLPNIQASLHCSDDVATSHGSMVKGLNAAYSAIFPCYLVLCVTGYAAFGSEVSAFLPDSIEPYVSDGMIVAIYAIIIVNSLALVSVYMQACFTLIEDILPSCFGHHHHQSNNDGRITCVQLGVRFVYIAFCTFVAAAIPFFGYLAALAGAICFTPLTFVYPFVFRNRVLRKEKNPSRRTCTILVLNGVIGGLFALLGLGAAIASVYFIVMESSTFQFFQ